MNTWLPAEPSVVAIARPIPDEAPVTTEVALSSGVKELLLFVG